MNAVLVIVYYLFGAGIHGQNIPAPSVKFCEEVMKPKALAELNSRDDDRTMITATCLPTQ